jgi:hypothetical protein
VASAASYGFFLPKAGETSPPAQRGRDCPLETTPLACAQKKARREGRTIIFIDECNIDLYTNREMRSFVWRVTSITDTEVIFNKGRVITDLIGNPIKLPNGTRHTGAQQFVPDYSLGKRWTARHRVRNASGRDFDTEIEYKVVAREEISVPAGVFNAFRIEGNGWNQSENQVFGIETRYWMAAEVRRFVASESKKKHDSGKVVQNVRTELVAYFQS